jgi:hypothetical protein
MNDAVGEILADVYARGKTNQYRLDEHFINDQEELSYQSDIILQSKLAIENYYRENPVFGVSIDKDKETE